MSGRPVPDDFDHDLFWQDHHNRQRRVERALERERYGPASLLHCPVCFKDLRAREMCAVCGDESDEAAA